MFETYRRLSLGLLVAFIGAGTWLQIVFAIFLIEVAVILHSRVNPFKAADDNTLQSSSYIAYLITLFYGLMIRSQEASKAMLQADIAIVIASINCIVIAIFSWQALLIAMKLRKLFPKMFKAFKASIKEGMKVDNLKKSDAEIAGEKAQANMERKQKRRQSLGLLDGQAAAASTAAIQASNKTHEA